MLIIDNRQFVLTKFDSEAGLKRVVTENAEYIFGPSRSIFRNHLSEPPMRLARSSKRRVRNPWRIPAYPCTESDMSPTIQTARYDVSVSDLIDVGLLSTGQRLSMPYNLATAIKSRTKLSWWITGRSRYSVDHSHQLCRTLWHSRCRQFTIYG